MTTGTLAALRENTFHTIVGDVKFGPNGEWVDCGCWRFSSRT